MKVNNGQWIKRGNAPPQPLTLFNMCIGKAATDPILKQSDYGRWLYNQIWIWTQNKAKRHPNELFIERDDVEEGFIETVWSMSKHEKLYAIEMSKEWFERLLEIEEEIIQKNKLDELKNNLNEAN